MKDELKTVPDESERRLRERDPLLFDCGRMVGLRKSVGSLQGLGGGFYDFAGGGEENPSLN